MTCFITVGTTLFEDLINEVLSDKNIEELYNVGIRLIQLQIGKGNFSKETLSRIFENKIADEGTTKYGNMNIEFYRYKPSLAKDMKNAMIIIGHAGAGTCLEVLRLQKPFIVVVNEKLMDNHQSELAIALSDRLHLLHCTPSTLNPTISNPGLFTLVPFKSTSQKRVSLFISRYLGLRTI